MQPGLGFDDPPSEGDPDEPVPVAALALYVFLTAVAILYVGLRGTA